MKSIILILTLTLLGFVGFSQNSCSGTMNLTDVPVRTNTTLAQAVRIGNGSSGQITVCIEDQHTDGKCGGVEPTLYIEYYNGTTTEAIYQIWEMRSTPSGTCITFPLCGEYFYLKRTSCINNDGSNTTISWYYTNYQGGEYRNQCDNSIIQADTIVDCIKATQICDTGTYLGNANGLGIQEIGCSSPSGNDDGCLSGENNSAWYWFEVQTSGTVTFNITPATNKDDYDFAVWGPNPSCTNLGSPTRCNFALNKGATGLNTTAAWDSEDNGCVNGAGCTNTGYSSQLTVTSGEIYYLLVDGYLTATDPNYSISFGGTADILCPNLPMSLDPIVKPIIIREEDLPEPLKILQYMTIDGRVIKESDVEFTKGLIIVTYEDGTKGKLPIVIK